MPLPLVASCCHDDGKGLLPACSPQSAKPHTVELALNKLYSSRATLGFRFLAPCECVPLLDMMECPFQATVRAFTNAKRGMDMSHPATPAPSPCPGREGSNGDVMLAVLLVTVAGVAVLLLLYRLLQLHHRLKMARARHALEYYGFYHSATYRLQHVPLYEDEAKTGTKTCPGPGPGPALIHTVTSLTPPTLVVTSLPPVPPPPMTCPPPEQAPPLYQATSFEEATPLIIPPLVVPATPSLLLPPVRQVTPPSPHLSWGACSDAELYSRIGAYRSSRLSSLSSQSRVILFEHSSL